MSDAVSYKAQMACPEVTWRRGTYPATNVEGDDKIKLLIKSELERSNPNCTVVSVDLESKSPNKPALEKQVFNISGLFKSKP